MAASSTAASPPPQRPIVGPVDAYGNPLVPRSRYLRDLISASAPPGLSHTPSQSMLSGSFGPNHSGAAGSGTIGVGEASHDSTVNTGDGGSHNATTNGRSLHRDPEPVRSTMLRRLEEDLAECTFQPNINRRRLSLTGSRSLSEGAQPLSSSSNLVPQSKPRSAGEPDIFQRLYHKTTKHLSRPLADKLGGDAAVEPAAPAAKKRGVHDVLARNPFGPPTAPPPEKAAAHSVKAPPPKPKKAPRSTDPVPAIHLRLYKEASKPNTTEQAIEKKRQISHAKAMEAIEKWAALEKEKDLRLEQVRKAREAQERDHLEAHHRALWEHIHNRDWHPARSAPLYSHTYSSAVAAQQQQASHASSGPMSRSVGALASPQPVPPRQPNHGKPPRDAPAKGHQAPSHHHPPPVAPTSAVVTPPPAARPAAEGRVHHSASESGMLLTPNGTWLRTNPEAVPPAASPAPAPAPVSEGVVPELTSEEPQFVAPASKAPASAPASRRPPGVAPLPLSRVRPYY